MNSTNIYFIRCGEFVKIGRGADPHQRAKALQTGNPYGLEVMGSFEATEAEERRLQDAFAQFHHRDEWFFLSDAIRDFIKLHCSAAVQVPDRPKPILAMTQIDEVSNKEREHASQFAVERLSPGGEASLKEIRDEYRAWCPAERRLSDDQIGRALAKLFDHAGIEVSKRNGRLIAIGVSLKQGDGQQLVPVRNA